MSARFSLVELAIKCVSETSFAWGEWTNDDESYDDAVRAAERARWLLRCMIVREKRRAWAAGVHNDISGESCSTCVRRASAAYPYPERPLQPRNA